MTNKKRKRREQGRAAAEHTFGYTRHVPFGLSPGVSVAEITEVSNASWATWLSGPHARDATVKFCYPDTGEAFGNEFRVYNSAFGTHWDLFPTLAVGQKIFIAPYSASLGLQWIDMTPRIPTSGNQAPPAGDWTAIYNDSTYGGYGRLWGYDRDT